MNCGFQGWMIFAISQAMLPLTCGAFNGDAKVDSDHQAIIRAATEYALGVALNDRQRLERAYIVPKAQLKLVEARPDGERIFIVPIADLMAKIWLKTPRVEDAKVKVLNLHVVEGKMATIVIDNNGQFLDMLSLYKVNGDWRIVDKLAIRHPLAAPMKLDLEGLFGAQE